MSRLFYMTLILLLGFSLRVLNLGEHSLSDDESLTAERAHSSLEESISSIIGAGNQVPLYYLLLRLSPTPNEFLLRYPSVLCGIIGIALFIHVADRYIGSKIAGGAGLLLATNPYHILYSQTARPYALMFVLALLSSHAFIQLTRGSRSAGRTLLLSSGAVYLTHYFSVFLPLAQFITLKMKCQRVERQWWRIQLTAIIPLMWWWGPILPFWIYAQIQGSNIDLGIDWISPPRLIDLPLSFANLAVGYSGQRIGLPGVVAAAVGFLISLRSSRLHFHWVVQSTVPVLVIFAASQFKPMYIDRYFIAFMPGILLLMLYGWKRWWWLGTLIVCASSLGILSTHPVTHIDWRSVSAYISQQDQPGDRVLDENLSDAYRYYFASNDLDRIEVTDEISSRVWVIYPIPSGGSIHRGVFPDIDPFEPEISPTGDWLIAHQNQIKEQVRFSGIYVFLVEP